MPQVRRAHLSRVRFTDAEFATIRERARAVRRPVARYIREAALGALPRVAAGADPALIRELLRVANALDCLAGDDRIRDAAVGIGEPTSNTQRLEVCAALEAVNGLVARL